MSLPFASEIGEDGDRPVDVGDAGLGQLLLGQGVRSPQRHHEPPVLDEEVVEAAEELATDGLGASRAPGRSTPTGS